MDDQIGRQAAIDALDVLCQEHRYKIPGKRETYSEYNEAWQDALDRAESAIGNLPSAQPEAPCYLGSPCEYQNPDAEIREERTEKRTESHACDLISRKAAIDAAALSAAEWDGMYVQDINERIRKALEQLPPVQPERKKGKWKFEKMKHIINGEVRDAIICSECDSGYFRYDISDNTVQNIPNFCPNCGADMREERDGD